MLCGLPLPGSQDCDAVDSGRWRNPRIEVRIYWESVYMDVDKRYCVFQDTSIGHSRILMRASCEAFA